MSISVLEVLMNAKHNFENAQYPFQRVIAKAQLSNAIEQLEKDSDANHEFVDEEESCEILSVEDYE